MYQRPKPQSEDMELEPTWIKGATEYLNVVLRWNEWRDGTIEDFEVVDAATGKMAAIPDRVFERLFEQTENHVFYRGPEE